MENKELSLVQKTGIKFVSICYISSWCAEMGHTGARFHPIQLWFADSSIRQTLPAKPQAPYAHHLRAGRGHIHVCNLHSLKIIFTVTYGFHNVGHEFTPIKTEQSISQQSI